MPPETREKVRNTQMMHDTTQSSRHIVTLIRFLTDYYILISPLVIDSSECQEQ